MNRETVRNLLAAFGAIFVVLVLLAVFIPLLSGGDGLGRGDKIGIVEVKGVILEADEINRQIADYSKRDDIKAVVLRINSPGGGVGPSQEIYREVKRLREKKKVVASFGSIAASGGYYIAAGADRIVANPGTITGSIGVIVEFMNFEGLLEKIGLKGSVIKSGEFKDTGSPLRELTDKERKLVQGIVDDVHAQFVAAVADGRDLNKKAVEEMADGRIFSGAEAKERGLVDELGSMGDAVKLVSRLAGIRDEPKLVYPKKKMEGIFKYLFEDSASSAISGLYSGLKVMYLARPFN